ncbi:MAG: DUF3572 domain-containing protein [Pseudomonadota bacterium]
METERQAAETIALQVLAWLAGQSDLLEVFMGATGAGQDDLRMRAADPEFLVAVLDFVLMDDAWIGQFCTDHGMPGTALKEARAAFPGGEEMHWT